MARQPQPERGHSGPQTLAERAAAALDHYLHIEALSGGLLLAAAAAALIWANSPAAAGYESFWHAPLTFGIGSWVSAQPLHFWINDGLMTVFFLVVGMEIRRELHEGALGSLRLAALPLAAALGGVAVPALLFVLLNSAPPVRDGWAVPTATDIAFAVGVLALLGRKIPGGIRIILLALAIIDDVVAVLIIALFYSDGLAPSGLLVAAAGVLLVLGFQRAGIGSAWAYLLPGAVVWTGVLMAGAHPTLAGVMLGLLTPVHTVWRRAAPELEASRIAQALAARPIDRIRDATRLVEPVRKLEVAAREVLPPVVRVQMALHPWVAYLAVPLFALANAGVAIQTQTLSGEALQALLGVAVALALGKPLGVVGAAWCVVRMGWCRLPAGVTWPGVVLIGLLTGIGFTMSIFIAMLAYADKALLDAAKLGVLLGSTIAALLGLAWGAWVVRRHARRMSSRCPGNS